MSTFNTNFPHRVNANQDNKIFNVIDAVSPSLERAIALADLLEVAFDAVDDLVCFEPSTLWRAVQAIRFEIKDAQTLLNACYGDEKLANQGVPNEQR